MQIACRCKYCGFNYMSEDSNDLAIELDFAEEEIRYVCRKCKRSNRIQLVLNRKADPLPGIIAINR